MTFDPCNKGRKVQTRGMKVNESSTDRYLRIALGLVLFGLAIMVGHTLGIVLGVVGVVALVTGVVGFCPLYKVLGISTCPR